MSKKGRAIAKGCNAFESKNDVATLREVGNRFCRTHSTTRNDMSKVHYHCNGVFDSLGRSVADEGLHGHNYSEVPI